MDPATGRRWTSCRAFIDELFVHEMAIDAAAWREWAGSKGFLEPLGGRLGELGLKRAAAEARIAAALRDPGYAALATLDAAVRMTRSRVEADALGTGGEAEALMCEALAIFRRTHGARSFEVAGNLHNLAALVAGCGPAHQSEAERLYRGALAIKADVLGPGQPDLVLTLHNLAVVLHERGQVKEAIALAARAVRIARTRLGRRHPHTALLTRHVAMLKRSGRPR